MKLIRYYIWRLFIKLTRRMHIAMLINTKCGIKNLNFNLMVTSPSGKEHICVDPKNLFLGPDFLKDNNTLLDYSLLKTPHYELMVALSNKQDIKKTDYYRRHESGTLDWRYFAKPNTVTRFYKEFDKSIVSVAEGTYPPVKVYRVGNKYYIYDGKHRAAMCAFQGKMVNCELVDAEMALGGVFSYLFQYVKSKKNYQKHCAFYNMLCEI